MTPRSSDPEIGLIDPDLMRIARDQANLVFHRDRLHGRRDRAKQGAGAERGADMRQRRLVIPFFGRAGSDLFHRRVDLFAPLFEVQHIDEPGDAISSATGRSRISSSSPVKSSAFGVTADGHHRHPVAAAMHEARHIADRT